METVCRNVTIYCLVSLVTSLYRSVEVITTVNSLNDGSILFYRIWFCSEC